MQTQTTLATAGLIILKDNKSLLAFSKKKQAWYLPGGKVDAGENTLETIVREIKEELSIDLDPNKLQYYSHTTAQAYGEPKDTIMEQDCFLYNPVDNIVSNNEIAAVKYFSLDEYKLESVQVVGVLTVFERLQKDNLLN